MRKTGMLTDYSKNGWRNPGALQPSAKSMMAMVGLFFLTMLMLTACRGAKHVITDPDVVWKSVPDEQKGIVFISGEIEQDTTSGTCTMTVREVRLLPGTLKQEEHVAETDTDFSYEMRNSEGSVISTHPWKNPLVRVMETAGEGGELRRVVTQLQKSEFFLRLKRPSDLRSVAFKHKGTTLKTVEVQ